MRPGLRSRPRAKSNLRSCAYPRTSSGLARAPVGNERSRWQTAYVRSWRVAGALVRQGDSLLLVSNRRRNGSIDWSPPGGVLEPHEAVLDALSRETAEETGLVVHNWSDPHYRVTVYAPGLGWQLEVSSHEARRWTGELAIADPDGIVEEARFVDIDEASELLADAALWVQIPVLDWLTGRHEPHYVFDVHGDDRATVRVERRISS
jgi:8-oxo-dGTP diphosphatase